MGSFTSPAAQVIIAIVPITGIAFGAILVFFALLWHHRETKLKIRNGTAPQKKFNLYVFSLLSGLLLFGVGLVLTAMFLIIDGLAYSVLGGLIPFIIGVMLLIFTKVNSEFKRTSDNEDK